jgi:hypothetical protein
MAERGELKQMAATAHSVQLRLMVVAMRELGINKLPVIQEEAAVAAQTHLLTVADCECLVA